MLVRADLTLSVPRGMAPHAEVLFFVTRKVTNLPIVSGSAASEAPCGPMGQDGDFRLIFIGLFLEQGPGVECWHSSSGSTDILVEIGLLIKG